MIAFTREQEIFRRSVARFVDAEVAPAAQAMDEQAEFPTALFRRIGELGYFGHGPIMHEKCFEVPYLEGKIR